MVAHRVALEMHTPRLVSPTGNVRHNPLLAPSSSKRPSRSKSKAQGFPLRPNLPTPLRETHLTVNPPLELAHYLYSPNPLPERLNRFPHILKPTLTFRLGLETLSPPNVCPDNRTLLPPRGQSLTTPAHVGPKKPP